MTATPLSVMPRTVLGLGPGSSESGVNSDAFVRDSEIFAMQAGWNVITAVTNGSDYMRSLANVYLPQEPRESANAWASRVRRSVVTPATSRLIESAAGLVLRRPVTLEGGDPFWRDTFVHNVDGWGSGLNEFARKRLVNALAYGHSAIMVDFPQAEARTLKDQRDAGAKPYWMGVDAQQILGRRQRSTIPSSSLVQLRILEMRKTPQGDYGEKTEEVVRVLDPGSYRIVNRKGETVESGDYSLDRIPVVPIYAQRTGLLTSTPPLLDIAYLNIAHYQRQADLLHALHVAAMPILVLEGWDENKTTAGVNMALSMEPGNKAYYVQSDASSFEAQANMLVQLENQMSHLGITKLLSQKMVAEAADAKRIDQQQANSVLGIISMELESSLNDAFRISAEYMEIEPPIVKIDRSFDMYKLLGQDCSVLSQMEAAGQITTETFLKIMKIGEWLPEDVDIAEEAAATAKLKEQAKKEQQQMMKAKAPVAATVPASEASAAP